MFCRLLLVKIILGMQEEAAGRAVVVHRLCCTRVSERDGRCSFLSWWACIWISFRLKHGKVLKQSVVLFGERQLVFFFCLSSLLGVGFALWGVAKIHCPQQSVSLSWTANSLLVTAVCFLPDDPSCWSYSAILCDQNIVKDLAWSFISIMVVIDFVLLDSRNISAVSKLEWMLKL